jgi:hypothetical protein
MRHWESIMLGFQPFKGAPVSPLASVSFRFRYPRLPSKPPPHCFCLSYRSIIVHFTLALMGELVTV